MTALEVGDVVRLKTPRIRDAEWGYTVDDAPPMVVQEVLEGGYVRCVYWIARNFEWYSFLAATLVKIEETENASA